MSERVKVGIAGLGRAGMCMHLPELKKFRGCYEIVAGCDIAPSRLEAFHREEPQAACCSDYDSLLRDRRVDLVAVAVFSADHVLFAEKALAAGKRVFLEKPFALTAAGAARLREMCRRYPDRIFFRLNRRFESGFRFIRRVMASGVLGETDRIVLRRHSYVFRDDWQTLSACGGGQLNNWGPHLIDQALILLESPVRSVWSRMRRVAALGDAEDNVHFIFTGENRRIAEVEISGSTAVPGNTCEIHGSRGSLVSADGENFFLRRFSDGFEPPERRASPLPPSPDTPFYAPENIPQWHEEKFNALKEIGEDIDACYGHLHPALVGAGEYPVSSDEALRVVEMTLAIREQGGAEFPLAASDH